MTPMRECGHTLKLRRSALGLSRPEAYKKFRVPLNFIADIEDGYLEGLPPPIYTRGFIKTYCEALGLPHHPVLDAYEDQLHRPIGPFQRLRIVRRSRPKWLEDALLWAAVLGVVIVSWLSYSLIVHPGRSRAESAVQAQSIEVPINDPFSAP